MRIRKTAFLFAAALTAAAVAGCSGSRETAATTSAEASAEETTAVEEESPETAKDTEDAENTENAGDGDEENYETGDASLDNPRNQDDIGENELLVVSFGTSYNDSRRLTVEPSRMPSRRRSRSIP